MKTILTSANLLLAILLMTGGAFAVQSAAYTPHAARAATASNLLPVYIAEDSFENYDFTSSTNIDDWHVDWAISMVYWNNADINTVKSIHSGFSWPGGSQYGVVNDGSGDWIDSDAGIKDALCSFSGGSTRHMRLYAPPYDFLYNTSWGYYVIGSTHEDYQECTGSSQFGWSETVESVFANDASSKGYSVLHNWDNFQNYEAPRWEGNHYWNDNGYATFVRVP